jgi:hypothetical protein
MTEWKVGMKAVCINDEWGWRRPGDVLPRKGEIARVIGVGNRPECSSYGGGETSLRLEGFGENLFFWHVHFRPAVEPNIKVFEDILARLPKQLEEVLG